MKSNIVTSFTPRSETYHPISPSGFKLFDECAFYYWNKYINPDYVEVDKTTKAMNNGSAIHAYLDSEAKFKEQFRVAPKVDKRTPEGKRIHAEFELESFGKDILSYEEYDNLLGTAKAIATDPRSWYLQGNDSQNECKFETTFPEPEGDNIFIRGILDRITTIPSVGRIIIDYKTIAKASPYMIARACKEHGYYNQAQLYLRAFPEVDIVLFVFIEPKSPYLWQIYSVERGSPVFTTSHNYVSNKLHHLSTLLQDRSKEAWPRYEMQDIAPLPLNQYYGQ